MFTAEISEDEKFKFEPFTLHMRITTRDTARNLLALLLPASLDKNPTQSPSKAEQIEIANDIRDMVSDYLRMQQRNSARNQDMSILI